MTCWVVFCSVDLLYLVFVKCCWSPCFYNKLYSNCTIYIVCITFLSCFFPQFAHITWFLSILSSGRGWLEVRRYGHRQNLPVGFRYSVCAGNSRTFPPATYKLLQMRNLSCLLLPCFSCLLSILCTLLELLRDLTCT